MCSFGCLLHPTVHVKHRTSYITGPMDTPNDSFINKELINRYFCTTNFKSGRKLVHLIQMAFQLSLFLCASYFLTIIIFFQTPVPIFHLWRYHGVDWKYVCVFLLCLFFFSMDSKEIWHSVCSRSNYLTINTRFT